MVTYSSCRLEYIRDNFPLCLSGQLWITGNETGSYTVRASQRTHNFHSQALDEFKSDNEPIYFNTFPHHLLQQIINPSHAVWFLRHDWTIAVRDWFNYWFNSQLLCADSCMHQHTNHMFLHSFLSLSAWLWASSGPSLKRKLATTFVFRSCSSDHNNCTGRRVCEILSSRGVEEIVSHGEKSACFHAGTRACCGNDSEVNHLPRSKLSSSPGFPYRNVNCFQRPSAFVREKALSEEQINVHYHQLVFLSAQSSVSRRVGVAESERGERMKGTQSSAAVPLGWRMRLVYARWLAKGWFLRIGWLIS